MENPKWCIIGLPATFWEFVYLILIFSIKMLNAPLHAPDLKEI